MSLIESIAAAIVKVDGELERDVFVVDDQGVAWMFVFAGYLETDGSVAGTWHRMPDLPA